MVYVRYWFEEKRERMNEEEVKKEMLQHDINRVVINPYNPGVIRCDGTRVNGIYDWVMWIEKIGKKQESRLIEWAEQNGLKVEYGRYW